jgi:hypothetical protein
VRWGEYEDVGYNPRIGTIIFVFLCIAIGGLIFVVIQMPGMREQLAGRARDGLLRVPIAVLAALSILFAIGAGNEWMTPVFLMLRGSNSASVPLVVLAQSIVMVTVLYKETTRFGLTSALAMAVLTMIVMPFNVFAAFVGGNFEGPGGAGAVYLLFMLTQAAVIVATVSAFAMWKRQHGGPVIDSNGLLFTLAWAMALFMSGAA